MDGWWIDGWKDRWMMDVIDGWLTCRQIAVDVCHSEHLSSNCINTWIFSVGGQISQKGISVFTISHWSTLWQSASEEIQGMVSLLWHKKGWSERYVKIHVWWNHDLILSISFCRYFNIPTWWVSPFVYYDNYHF